MSYGSFEQSRAKGEIISLYHFFYVNNEEYLYTDAESDFSTTLPGHTYKPMPIQRGNITTSGSLDKSSLEIRMPGTAGLADAFREYPPNEVVNVIIRQRHRDDPDGQAMVVFTGRVLGASWEGNEVKFSCEPISTALRRSGLRRHYQIGCPHVLYGTQCAASRAAATTPEIVVQGISGSTIFLPVNWLPEGWGAAGKTMSKFVGGLVQWNYSGSLGPGVQKRTILKLVGTEGIMMAGKPIGLVEGDSVTLTLGCNHQLSDCLNVHNNVPNYGGQPFIPVKNPFGWTNNYY